jgi:hypothetical protein
VRPKRNTIVIRLAPLCQAKDLESARVSQDGPIPTHEAVQPTETRHYPGSRPEMKVIRVPQEQLDAKLSQVTWIERFDRPLRANGREARRRNGAVRGCQPTNTSAATGITVQQREFERHSSSLSWAIPKGRAGALYSKRDALANL